MNLLCWLFGHRWELRRVRQDDGGHLWLHVCARCGQPMEIGHVRKD